MAIVQVRPTGVERRLGREELIVSKTDTRGIILYANQIFLRMSDYSEEEIIGQPHNVIRHPDMPRGVFKLLWDRTEGGHEIFAVVNNLAKNGDNYWVLAHVTPTYDDREQIIGYHSNRRAPSPALVAAIQPIYAKMVEVERPYSKNREAATKSVEFLVNHLGELGTTYDEFIFKLLMEHQGGV